MKKSTNFFFWQKIYFFLLSVFLSGFAFGQVSAYGFSQSNGSYTPITGGTVYSSNTTTTLDSEVYTNLPIGFTFVYNGISYDAFGMNVNGWISMGSTTPVSSHTPISSGTTNNVISAAAMDLFGRQFFTGSTTSGSAAVAMTAGSTLGISVGDAMSGTGITTGSLVNAVTTNNVTMNANATTTGTGRNIRFHNGTIRYETIGAAPNRKLVVQWSKFSRYTTVAPSDYFNFQIVLNEGSNIINFIYDFPYVNASNIFEVGLRGAASTDFNNRTTTSNWASTTAGTLNTATSTATNTIFPASGLTYTWTPPTCFSPTGLTSSNVTSSTATISWTAPGTAPASGYEYYRSTSSTAPTASTTPTGSTLAGTTTADLTSLSAGTTYYFWVRGKCSDTDFSNWSSQGTFTTACNLPSEPASISFSAVSATATTITWTAPTTAPTAYVVFRSTSNVAPTLTNGTQYTVNSTTAVSSLTNGTNTYFCIYNGTALTNTQSALTANTQYYYYVFSRNGTTGVSPDCSGAPWYSSANINGSKTTCAGAPTSFTSSAFTNNSATIGWTAPTGGGTAGTLSYTVEVYTDSGYTTAVSGYPVTGITTNTYNLTGLSTSTLYYIRVKANNGSCDSSYLTGTLTTSQVLASLDFADGFEGTNNWSFVNGTQTNKWVVGSAVNNGGANSLYISNDSGTTNVYTITSTSVVQAYRDIEIPTGTTNLELSFDWKANGESCCDYLRVWLVPLSYVPTAGTQITSGSGRIQVGGNFNVSTAFATYQNNNVDFSTFAGQSARLVFEWRNDVSVGTQNPAAIDNVSLKKPCAAAISAVTGGENCGTGTVTLSATGNASTTEYKWYAAATGGSALATTTSGSWTTPSVSSSTTYYVAASTGLCESLTRTAVTATIKQFPTAVDITNTNASICGGIVQTLTATGGVSNGTATIGTGATATTTSSYPNPFSGLYGGVKHQMIYTAAELSAQGLTAGSTIKSVGLNIAAFAAKACKDFTIRMKLTTASTLTAFETGTTTVYNSTTFTPSATGWAMFTLSTPFLWDGTSNLIVETVHNAGNSGNGSGTTVFYTATTGNNTVFMVLRILFLMVFQGLMRLHHGVHLAHLQIDLMQNLNFTKK